jgi:hypothetical protein
MECNDVSAELESLQDNTKGYELLEKYGPGITGADILREAKESIIGATSNTAPQQ